MSLKSIDKCTGCGACAVSCNQHAISMQLDSEGFLFPKLENSLCIKCELCDAVCAKASESVPHAPQESYTAYARSTKERETGSSGGVFGVLAGTIVKKGGVVFGAAYIPQEKKVVHISTNEVPLERIKKSKYVQSDTARTYQEVKKLCADGIPVLYVGTPCQISGLHAYLESDYSTLLTMDFVCHGVPSPGLFADMILQYEHARGSSVEDVTFRDKEFGWRSQMTRVYFEDGSVAVKKSRNTPYFNLFIHNYSLRKSCFFCERYHAHPSDITVADHWRIAKDRDDDRGVSLIAANTDKGAEALREIKNDLFLEPYQEKNPEIYSHANYDIRQRNDFFKCYTTNGMETTFNRYERILSRLGARQKAKSLLRSVFDLPHAVIYHFFKRNIDT